MYIFLTYRTLTVFIDICSNEVHSIGYLHSIKRCSWIYDKIIQFNIVHKWIHLSELFLCFLKKLLQIIFFTVDNAWAFVLINVLNKIINWNLL